MNHDWLVIKNKLTENVNNNNEIEHKVNCTVIYTDERSLNLSDISNNTNLKKYILINMFSGVNNSGV